MPQMDEGDQWVRADAAAVAQALRAAGVAAAPSDVELLPRDERFAARLPGDRMAWFPANAAGLARLRRERAILRLIAEHDAFAAPRVLHEAPEGWDLRALVAGPCDPERLYHRVLAEPAFTRRLGAELGRLLARQHALPIAPLAGIVPTRPSWPESVAYARERLPGVTDDAALTGRALSALEAYDAAEAAVSERVLVHADFAFHNMVIDPESGRLAGVFDYDGAALSDRSHDFKYLLFDAEDDTLLDAAVAAYAPLAGAAPDRARVRLLNAASAVTFLAFRAGSGPDERPAGRTLAEDLAWTRLALERAGF
jgi:aminoglycoside phosphotransferase (APT) family kinase protein